VPVRVLILDELTGHIDDQYRDRIAEFNRPAVAGVLDHRLSVLLGDDVGEFALHRVRGPGHRRVGDELIEEPDESGE